MTLDPQALDAAARALLAESYAPDGPDAWEDCDEATQGAWRIDAGKAVSAYLAALPEDVVGEPDRNPEGWTPTSDAPKVTPEERLEDLGNGGHPMSDFYELPRTNPRRVLRSLMLAENMGDVHDEINLLHDHFGIPRPEGDFLGGFTEADLLAVEGGVSHHDRRLTRRLAEDPEFKAEYERQRRAIGVRRRTSPLAPAE